MPTPYNVTVLLKSAKCPISSKVCRVSRWNGCSNKVSLNQCYRYNRTANWNSIAQCSSLSKFQAQCSREQSDMATRSLAQPHWTRSSPDEDVTGKVGQKCRDSLVGRSQDFENGEQVHRQSEALAKRRSLPFLQRRVQLQVISHCPQVAGPSNRC